MKGHPRIPVEADLIRQAESEGWSIGDLAIRANVSLYVAEARCRELGIVLRKVYKARGGSHNRTGNRRHIPVVGGVPVPPNGKMRNGRFSERLATTVRDLDAEEQAKRRMLLQAAKGGDAEAIATLRTEYRLTVLH